MLSPQAITAMRAGPELDRAVRKWVFQGDDRGKAPAYSTTQRALDLLRAAPISVGRFSERDPEFSPGRPYYARFALGPINEPHQVLVTAATPEVALCKGALIYIYEGGKTITEETDAQRPDTQGEG